MRAGPAAALTAALAVGLAAVPRPVWAADTVTLDHAGQITDQVGALGGRADAVRRALTRLEDDHRYQLFVVYVRDFSDHEAQSWADGVADRNRLGPRDLLLAVATHERRYALSADVHSGFSGEELERVESVAIGPPLHRADWAGAAIAAAEGFAAADARMPVPRPSITPGDPDPGPSPGSWPGDWVVPVLLLAGATALAVFLIRHGERGLPPVVPPTALDTHVRALLIDLDDDVRDRAGELSFTPSVPRSARTALDAARAGTAMALREKYAADAAAAGAGTVARRRALTRIAERCALARERLAAAGPVAAAGTAGAATAVGRRIADLAAPARALPAARLRAATAREELARARRALGRGDRSTAARAVRAPRAATVAAETLLAATARRTAAAARAAILLAEARAGTAADLAAAPEGRAAPDAIARAKAALAGVRPAHAPSDPTTPPSAPPSPSRPSRPSRSSRPSRPSGPFEELRATIDAGAALAGALAPDRTAGARDGRARALLGQALFLARAEVSWADALVTAHRDSVGGAARAALAAASAALADALARADRDPARALAAARRADALARTALDRLERDAGPLT